MKLSVATRIQIPQLLQQKGDLVTLQLREDIMDKTELSQDEMVEIGFEAKQEGQMVSYKWDESKEKDIEVEFSTLEMRLLKEAVTEKDKKKDIPLHLVNLCKLINDYKAPEKVEPKK